ncbi:MAG: GH116 family glycosyl-hydrolase [Candidatus Omnitrophota bacterium]
MRTKIYPKKELCRFGPQKTLKGRNLDEVSFPLGGIGTGMISLGGWGQLREWEIMNRPAKGFVFRDSFFSLRINRKKGVPLLKVLQGPAGGTYVGGGHSARRDIGEGLPHFRKVSFTGSYPFANVEFEDPDVPLKVSLEAFNPFIPLNDKDSSIPVAVLRYHLKNTGREKVSGTIFGNLRNLIGHPEKEGRKNEAKRGNGLTGLWLTTSKFKEDSPRFGNMALTTTWEKTKVWPSWKENSLNKFWEAIAEEADFPQESKSEAEIGTIAADFEIGPGETISIPFFIAWYFPIFEHYWDGCKADKCQPVTWKNYYATVWDDAWDVAGYVAENFNRLYEETKIFHDSLFSSKLPTYVLDAISSQMSILKTTTCLRLTDGTFYGFEGCGNEGGCCQGSCTHVWNYAQALPYLFPNLQRSMREADYKNNMAEDGMLQFRLSLPLGKQADWQYHPAADGQMGVVMQIYREWKISGDDNWLKKVWPYTKKALEFAWKYWDADKDGVMEGMQHNTYDIEFYGPNTMMGSLYLGALRAAEEIARHLSEDDKAEEYHALFLKGSAWYDKNLFNGEYYEQKVNPDAHLVWPETYRKITEDRGRDDKFPWPKWQYGKGCLSDQMIGQWYAEMLGLGYLFGQKHIRRALQAIFKYNWLPSMHKHSNFLRIYALNEEPGLLIGTWPCGGRPGYGFYFADEVWTGIEYQFASHLIYEGLIEEGLTVVSGVRKRYDGERRNPWNEIECGHHYARAMSSYALLLSLSGFFYSAPEKTIGFSPRISEDDFNAFFSVGSGWGTYHQKFSRGKAEFAVEVKYGSLELKYVKLISGKISFKNMLVTLAGKQIDADRKQNQANITVVFKDSVTVQKGGKLNIVFNR